MITVAAGCAADSEAGKQAGQGAGVGTVSGSMADNAAEESGDKALASSVYSKMGGSVDKARADALEGVIKVQAARRELGVPPCK